MRDGAGNPVAGVSVTFAVPSGQGTVSPTTPLTTGVDGIAAATSWVLGPTAGPNTVTVRVCNVTGNRTPASSTYNVRVIQ